MKPELNFKVGDKVKIVDIQNEEVHFIGETGTIINVISDHVFPYEIKYHNETINTDTVLFNDDELELLERDVSLTKEQALQILACLGTAIYETDNEFIKTNEDRRVIIETSHTLAWNIADQLGINLDDEYVDFNTLELKKY